MPGASIGRVSLWARRCGAVLTLALWPCAALYAQSPAAPDPMASAECKGAREALDAAYRAATDRRDDTARTLQAARRHAAQVCLGRGATRDTPNRTPPAQAVPPVTPGRPQPTPGMPRVAPATPPPGPVGAPRPTLITACDDAGCWGSDGRRYNRAGSQLVGPAGSCSLQGQALNCP